MQLSRQPEAADRMLRIASADADERDHRCERGEQPARGRRKLVAEIAQAIRIYWSDTHNAAEGAGARQVELRVLVVVGRVVGDVFPAANHAVGTAQQDRGAAAVGDHRSRALAFDPKLLLMDEPFGALDALTRGTIQDELMAIVRETQQTVFMITHDVDEAILLADRIVLMTNGSESEGGYVPGGIAEIVTNPLPRDRTRAGLHHLPGYYDLRNHIVDFLVSRARAGGGAH